MKYEAKKLSISFFETLNIEWGQIDPKGNRRVKTLLQDPIRLCLYEVISSLSI